MKKKAYIFGRTGQLGKCLLETKPEDFEVLDVKNLCLTTRLSIMQDILDKKPDVVINAAASNSVDSIEDSIEYALLVNGVAPVSMYTVCKNMVGTMFVHVSSDFVFGGGCNYKKKTFTEEDSQYPENMYGFTKHVSDWIFTYLSRHDKFNNALMLRTSWLFSEFNDNFLTKMIRKLEDDREVYGADDVHGSPTYARDLAEVVWRLVSEKVSGVFNVANSGCVSGDSNAVSKYDFINEIAKACRLNVKLTKKSVNEMNLKAKRSVSTALLCDKYNDRFGKLRDWKDALNGAVKRFKDQTPCDSGLR